MCYISGERVAPVFYRVGDSRVSLFVLPERVRLGGLHARTDGTWEGGMHGCHMLARRARSDIYAMVTDLPEDGRDALWKAWIQEPG